MNDSRTLLEAEKKVVKARTSLVVEQPFFGALALRLQVKMTDQIDTAGTDTVHVHFNPDFVHTLSHAELIGLWCHECLHIALGHPWRLKGRNHRLFNESADFAINPILMDAGFILPAGGLYRFDLRDRSAEEIYDILIRERGTSPESSLRRPPDSQVDDSGGEVAETDVGRCGSFCEPSDDNGKALTEVEAAQAEAQWQIATVQAANSARVAGMMHANILRETEATRKPRYDLSAHLRRFLSSRVPSDYRMTPPNRRYLPLGLIMPSLIPANLGPLALLIDVSGSIGQGDLDLFSDVLNGILEDVTPERVTVIYVDSKVQHVDEFEPMDFPVSLKAHGGGGTDFKPGFTYIEAHGIDPVAAIYLTDLCCSSFPEEPEFPVLWVSTMEGKAPFGEIIPLSA